MMAGERTTDDRRRYSRRQVGGLAALVVAGATASIVLRRNSRLGIDIGDEPMVRQIHSDTLSPQIGPPESDVSLAVFTDYQCPICRRSDEALRNVAERDGNVRLIFKEWPILGDMSKQAAVVALMADRQDLYMQVHKALLNAPSLRREVFQKVIEDAGGLWEPVRKELEAPGKRTLEQLQRASNEAFALGLSGTPGYLVGRILVKGALTEDELEEVISLARELEGIR